MSLPEGQPVLLDRSRWWDVAPGHDGVPPLRVSVAWPDQPPPPAGYPVFFLLDAAAQFLTAVEAARLQAGRPAATGVPPMVVVGLDYPGDRAARVAARRHNFAPPPLGQADVLLETIGQRVMPAIAASLPVDPARHTLFGHSIGGLVPVHALLAGSALFQRYAAASPSLWLGDGMLLDRARTARPPPGRRLLLSVGALEHAGATNEPVRAARLAAARMLGNVRALAALLAPGTEVTCVEFDGENHGSVVPAAISRAIAFAGRA